MLAVLYMDRGLMLPAESIQSNSKCMEYFLFSKHHRVCIDFFAGKREQMS